MVDAHAIYLMVYRGTKIIDYISHMHTLLHCDVVVGKSYDCGRMSASEGSTRERPWHYSITQSDECMDAPLINHYIGSRENLAGQLKNKSHVYGRQYYVC